MLLVDDLNIVAEYEEYLEGSNESLWGKPYPCWIQFDALKQELSIKFEYYQEGKPSTYICFIGQQIEGKPNSFKLKSNKPDITQGIILLTASFDGDFWYFDGKVEGEYVEDRIQIKDIMINQIKS